MAPTATLREPLTARRTDHGWSRYRPWIFRALIAIAALIAIGIGTLALNWPFKKQSVINALQESSVRSVTMDRFERTYFPPGCVAEGIKFLNLKHKDSLPLITIRTLTVQGSYALLLTFRRRLSLVRVEGLRITIPPKEPEARSSPVMPLTHKNSGPKVKIGTVIADGAILEFASAVQSKPSLRMVIDKLALDGVGTNLPISYRATISNPKPPGEIRSKGRFGPWKPDDPARTPLTGSYTFRNADLGSFKFMTGTLSSSGNFGGMLDHIEVSGTTDTSDFHLSGSGHSRRLSTEFHAAVDTTNGDTFLQNVVGQFDRTTIVSAGRVAGDNGKLASLDLFATDARIEDLLNLFIEAKRAPMTGTVNFGAHVEIPPGDEQFVNKLKLHGDFGLEGGKFTNPKTQGSINKLSASAQKAEKHDSREEGQIALSNLKGHVTVTDGIATLTNLSFNIPGAFARLNGTYSLIDYTVDVHGTLVTKGKLSAATSGMKSVLVKAIAPLLKKRSGTRIIPFKITGKYQHTMVSLDIAANNRGRIPHSEVGPLIKVDR